MSTSNQRSIVKLSPDRPSSAVVAPAATVVGPLGPGPGSSCTSFAPNDSGVGPGPTTPPGSKGSASSAAYGPVFSVIVELEFDPPLVTTVKVPLDVAVAGRRVRMESVLTTEYSTLVPL